MSAVHLTEQAEFLVRVSDGDGDGALSRAEVVAHYDQFIASQATDYGAAITRQQGHEEL